MVTARGPAPLGPALREVRFNGRRPSRSEVVPENLVVGCMRHADSQSAQGKNHQRASWMSLDSNQGYPLQAEACCRYTTHPGGPSGPRGSYPLLALGCRGARVLSPAARSSCTGPLRLGAVPASEKCRYSTMQCLMVALDWRFPLWPGLQPSYPSWGRGSGCRWEHSPFENALTMLGGLTIRQCATLLRVLLRLDGARH